MPAVAATDSVNPQRADSDGASTTKISTAAARIDGPDRRPPTTSDTTTADPMTAARSTLGCGRTTTT